MCLRLVGLEMFDKLIAVGTGAVLVLDLVDLLDEQFTRDGSTKFQ